MCHPSLGAALFAASVASTATLAEIGGDSLLVLLDSSLLPLLGLGVGCALMLELGASCLPLGVEMGMFGGGPIPSLQLHLSSSSWQSVVWFRWVCPLQVCLFPRLPPYHIS